MALRTQDAGLAGGRRGAGRHAAWRDARMPMSSAGSKRCCSAAARLPARDASARSRGARAARRASGGRGGGGGGRVHALSHVSVMSQASLSRAFRQTVLSSFTMSAGHAADRPVPAAGPSPSSSENQATIRMMVLGGCKPPLSEPRRATAATTAQVCLLQAQHSRQAQATVAAPATAAAPSARAPHISLAGRTRRLQPCKPASDRPAVSMQ